MRFDSRANRAVDTATRALQIALLSAALACAGCADSTPSGTTDAAARDGAAPSDSGGASDAQSCAAPRPFVPPGKPAGFRHTTTKLTVIVAGAANHRGQDVVAVTGAPQLLVGKFAYGAIDKDLKGEDVEVFIQREPPCGPWVSHGVATTSQDGEHGTKYGVEDDGGRVFFTLPQNRALGVGRYPVRMLVKGDHSVAVFTLFVVAPGTQAVVFDIDGTLTTDDFQLVSQLFSKLLAGDYVPQQYADADAVARAWASKGYLPIYLTGRPDFLRTMSQKWLVEHKLPPGVVHLTDNNSQALPTSAGVAAYKGDFLVKLTGEAKLALYAAYGNAGTDIEAYARAKIDKRRTFIIGPNAGHDGTQAVVTYTAHLPTAQSAPTASAPAPVATFGW